MGSGRYWPRTAHSVSVAARALSTDQDGTCRPRVVQIAARPHIQHGYLERGRSGPSPQLPLIPAPTPTNHTLANPDVMPGHRWAREPSFLPTTLSVFFYTVMGPTGAPGLVMDSSSVGGPINPIPEGYGRRWIKTPPDQQARNYSCIRLRGLVQSLGRGEMSSIVLNRPGARRRLVVFSIEPVNFGDRWGQNGYRRRLKPP